MNRYAFKVLAVICALAFAGFLTAPAESAQAASAQGAHPAATPSRSQGAMPAALRPVLYQTLSKEAGPAAQLEANGCAVLPKQSLKACFNKEGAHFAGASSNLALHLAAFGRGDTLSQVKSVHPTIHANHVNYSHAAFAQTGNLVKIQGAPAFLQQATVVGQHALHSTMKLTFNLKGSNSSGGLTSAELKVVKGYLNAHKIQVTDVSPNRTVIHTRGTTRAYDHALGIMVMDYTYHGRTFFSSSDPVRLPASVAQYVTGVFAPIPEHQVAGHFSASNLAAGGNLGGAAAGATWKPSLILSPHEGAWTAIAPYPIPIVDNCAVTDPISGKVYSFTGVSNGTLQGADYVYDPKTDTWSSIADFPQTGGLEKPVCAYIYGKVYVTDGDINDGNGYSGGPNTELDIYDIASDSWNTGADLPSSGAEFGAVGVALDGKFYVIGGCPGSNCTPAHSISRVAVYDPGSDSWSMAADYPTAITWQGCGATQGVIVCAGGYITGSVATAAGYKYNPGSDSWSPIVDAMYSNWGMIYSATADGHLLFQNGITGDTGLQVNTGQIYDLASDTWSALPNNLVSYLRGAGACGFYMIGGMAGGFTGNTDAEVLPGHSPCVLTGPTGTVEGTVTDASTGNGIQGAKLSFMPGGRSTSTDSDGDYTITLPAGSYTATASAFGYQPSPPASVTVTDGGTTEQDFALQLAASAFLGGKVTDGGHGYPLYAEVQVAYNGTQVADTFTQPLNGNWKISLPTGNTYVVTANAYLPGYAPASATVTVAGRTRHDLALTPDASCTAPGYNIQFREDFDGGSFPPAGWTIVPAVSTVTWQVDMAGSVNYTGGTGNAADADSYATNVSGDPYDTSLITAPIQVADVGSSPVLNFLENYQDIGDDDTADVDISTDGGTTWTTVLSQTTTCGWLYALPGCSQSLQLGSYLDGATSFQLRFRYYNLAGAWDWYWQIDDLTIGTCSPIPGGLVVGTVWDRNTDEPLVGATLTDENGTSTQSTATAGGFHGFTLFEPAGTHTLTASYAGYASGTRHGSVADGQKRNVTYHLGAGQFTLSPMPISVSAPVDASTTVSLTITNVGTASAQWALSSLSTPAPAVLRLHGQHFGNVPLHQVPLHQVAGHFSPSKLQALGRAGRALGPARPGAQPLDDEDPQDAAWTAIAELPIPIMESCAASVNGKAYSITGVSNSAVVPNGYVYNPASDTWSPIADIPGGGLEKPACAAIGGKIYVTDGFASAGPNNTLYIYDVKSDSWSTGADLPSSKGSNSGAAGVALGGKFYVIGGCPGIFCSTFTSRVAVYDPASDSWSMAADYPISTAYQGCGAAGQVIVCGGGIIINGGVTAAAYKYNPASDTWSPVADLLYPNWGMAAIGTAYGKLLFQDGISADAGGFTNQGQIYDAGSDTWSMLPNNVVTTWLAAGACGFYMIGGFDVGGGGLIGITSAGLLAGYGICGVGPTGFLSFNPALGTLPAGQSANSTMTIDGTGQTAGTSTSVQVILTGGRYGNVIDPLTIHWTAPAARQPSDDESK